ncbi:adenylosuccinate lyase family protein [Amycolatopsis sp. lyj-90]|uniref:class-II fumarase/aspartase family protein n=1 Tax=Amycolatopsis sp. lyj-90 TaxID=2789285 RepID=UPI00397A53A4
MTEDAGLLSPVRAGTPIETVVSDAAWLQAMLDAEAALVRAQANLSLAPREAAEVITAAARAERLDLRALSLQARESANPVVGLVREFTRVVAAIDPAAAEYVHRGSTSQDIFDTAAMLIARRALRLVRSDLAVLTETLSGLAERHRDTALAGRTLALHAVPTTFGLKAAGWRQLLLDADSRVATVLGSLPISLGGAAGTLAGYLEYGAEPDSLLEAFAVETGLSVPVLPWHTLRTPIADLAGVLAQCAGALGKFAVDVQSLTRTEVGEVTEPHVPGRGASSAMPQKRNPVLATLIRSASLQVPALAAVLTQCMLTEDERSAGAWHAEWTPLRECLRLTGGAAHTAVELARGLVVRPERMRANLALTGANIVTERLVATFAQVWGKTTAKDLVTGAMEAAERNGTALATELATLPEITGRFGEVDLTRLCDPATYTGAAAWLVTRATRQAHPRPS